MPIDPNKVALAMQSGLSVVCATCEKYWEGVDRRLGKCTSIDGCGSPIAGDVFHEYKGPIERFDNLCFVCGRTSNCGIRVGNKLRVIGVCSDHVDLVSKLRPCGEKSVNVTIVSGDGCQELT